MVYRRKSCNASLGVTYKTAWRMGHEIRKYMAKVDGDDGLSGHVEIDETYVGGNAPVNVAEVPQAKPSCWAWSNVTAIS